MTRFGKILVLINLALSLVFLAWAFTFRTQRVDWTASRVVPGGNTVRAPNPNGRPIQSVESKETTVASATKDPLDPTVIQIKGAQEGDTRVVITDDKGNKQGFDVHVDHGVPGKLAEPIDQIKALQEVRVKLEGDYNLAHRDITALEKVRPEQRKWYEEQLRLLERGDTPVGAIDYAGGTPRIDSQDRPVLTKAKTEALPQILPREAYEKQLRDLATQIQEARDVVGKKIDEQAKLAKQLEDLRAKLAAEEDSLRRFAEEREELTPKLYNREALAQTVRDRRQMLEARLQELKRAGASAP
jgi:regulator of replication initiation timing